MRFSIVILIFFLSACATSITASRVRSVEYNKVRDFVVGFSTESDVVAILGAPTRQTEEKGYYTLSYDDSKTGFQRLSINFLSESHKLLGFLWIPQENEREYSLIQAKAGFKNANFKEVTDVDKNPHAISLDVISYIDEKSGVTIRHDRRQNFVEAIAIYDINNRVPAGTDKTNEIPYTFGDESVISK
jgi:hypothetical protein